MPPEFKETLEEVLAHWVDQPAQRGELMNRVLEFVEHIAEIVVARRLSSKKDEVVQNTRTRVWLWLEAMAKNCREDEIDVAKFQGFVVTVAKHCCFDLRRKSRKHDESFDERFHHPGLAEGAFGNEDLDLQIDLARTAKQIERQLAEMPEPQRRIVEQIKQGKSLEVLAEERFRRVCEERRTHGEVPDEATIVTIKRRCRNYVDVNYRRAIEFLKRRGALPPMRDKAKE